MTEWEACLYHLLLEFIFLALHKNKWCWWWQGEVGGHLSVITTQCITKMKNIHMNFRYIHILTRFLTFFSFFSFCFFWCLLNFFPFGLSSSLSLLFSFLAMLAKTFNEADLALSFCKWNNLKTIQHLVLQKKKAKT